MAGGRESRRRRPDFSHCAERTASQWDRGKGSQRIREAYGDAAWERLVAAKRQWDPDNAFRLNQNIDPSG